MRLLLSSVLLLAAGAGATTTHVTVRTRDGAVVGVDDGITTAFLGIPFAAPPVGSLRFRPPAPVSPWRAPRDATRFGPACPQNDANGKPSGNEDCLTLNVFRPDGADDHTPVLVFLFGGSFKHGSAAGGAPPFGPDYDGRRLAARTRAVVVTLNYRLGVLGFLASPVLDATDPRRVSGNYGLLDQQQALRWVHANATAFGYDGRRVTLFGQSAGALSIAEQIASPGADGLFGPVVLESAGALPELGLAAAERSDARILDETGCVTASDEAACLRETPVSTLLASHVRIGPVIDGTVIPRSPAAVLASRSGAHTPFVESTNLDEGTYFVAHAMEALGHPPTAAVVDRTLAASFGDRGARAIETEYATRPALAPDQSLAAIVTDEFFACPAAALHRELRDAGVPVVQAEFAEPEPVLDYPVPVVPGLTPGDAHATELAYVFEENGSGAALPAGPERSLGHGIGDAFRIIANDESVIVRVFSALPTDAVVTVAAAPSVSTDFVIRHHCGFWSASGLFPRLIGRID